MTQFVKQIARSKQKVIVLAPKYHKLPNADNLFVFSSAEEVLESLKDMNKRIDERLEKQLFSHDATIIIYNMIDLLQELTQNGIDYLTYLLKKGLKVDTVLLL